MESEKTCDFCSVLRPIVYCKADAANLCLPCDARVHSANALSSRHSRTLLCEICRFRSASVRCNDHRLFMCHGCNSSQHDLSSNHQLKMISTYSGCPSAADFAELWGFNLNQVEHQSLIKQAPELQLQDSEGHILQQILHLKMLQKNQGSGDSSLVTSHQEMDIPSFKNNAKQMPYEDLEQQLQHSLDLDSDLHSFETTYEEPFSTMLPQMEGDSFWHCKSPLQSGQLWTQNMQDLGVCDDPAYLGDFGMPDVDPTFKNIEEIFGGDQELAKALLSEDEACSSREKEMTIDKSGYERSVEDVSAASSTHMSYSANAEKSVDSKSSTEPESSNVSAKQRALMRFREKKKNRMSEKQTRYTNRKARSEVKKLSKRN